MKIHFVNVGKGSCTIIEHDTGRISFVDIDNNDVETTDRILTDPLEYYRRNINKGIFRFILTHPDMDHMSGIESLTDTYELANFWDIDNDKEIDEFPKYREEDWNRYQSFKGSEENPKYLNLLRNASGDCCWVEDGITILSPTQELTNHANETEEYHHASYVLMLEHNGEKILIGGEATPLAWDDIHDSFGDRLKCDVFLAPHHGSTHNINEDVFEVIDPNFVVISVGWGIEYDYDYYKRLANRDVFTTKSKGNIWVDTNRKVINYERK